MIDHLDLAEATEMEVMDGRLRPGPGWALLWGNVVMDTCKWPESCKIKFWTPCSSTIEPLLAVLEEQVAQVQLDICGPLFGLIPRNFN